MLCERDALANLESRPCSAAQTKENKMLPLDEILLFGKLLLSRMECAPRFTSHSSSSTERDKMLRKKEHVATFLGLADTMREKHKEQKTDKIDIVRIFYSSMFGLQKSI
jgi:hypothetical protein